MPICEVKAGDTVSINAWFEECKKKGIPCVTVLHRTKYSKVSWDYISIPREKDDILALNSRIIATKIKNVYSNIKLVNKKAKLSPLSSSRIGNIDNLLPEEAVSAANEISACLESALSSSL